MQQRLIVYWCVVILTLFLATVLLLSIIGVLPGMDFKVREMLSAQQKNTLSAMTEQTDIMMARSISLSEDITKELNQCLTANRILPEGVSSLPGTGGRNRRIYPLILYRRGRLYPYRK